MLGNGFLLGKQTHPPDAAFPHGSVTWHWASAAPVASYLVEDSTYASKDGFWTVAPSNPTPWALFGGSNTYARPGIAYIALRQILGHGNFARALAQIQRQYGGRSITESQLEAAFARWLPDRSAACTSRLGQFFRQWWDTAYPKGGRANRPHITGPGLAGPGFYTGGCTRP